MASLVKVPQLRDYLMGEFLDSDIAATLKRNIQPFQQLMAQHRCAIMEIETKFKVLNEEFSYRHDRNPIETIKTRLKSPESIARKLKKNKLPFSIQTIKENLSDIAGVRVICSFPKDIYTLADSLLQQDDITLIQRKDYIKTPKESGYQSLHLIVEVPIFLMKEKAMIPVEIQLRTMAMDFWASLEHKLQYKKNIPAEEAAAISRELLECSQMITALDNRMEDIKNRLTQDKEA